MNNSVRLKENDGKYSIIKEGGKRALRVFMSKQEALDYIQTHNLTLIEETMDIIVNVPLVPEKSEEVKSSYDLPAANGKCCGGNCGCKKPSLITRIINFFKKPD